MFALISPEKTQIPPGAVVRIPGTWKDYQILCEQRSDRTIPRLKVICRVEDSGGKGAKSGGNIHFEGVGGCGVG